MDKVYTFLPSCIPPELHPLIHMFAGTCTPSCDQMKIYIDYIERNRPSKLGATLWSSQIQWQIPIYVKRLVQNEELTAPELDLKVAWHVLKHERFLELKWEIVTYEYASTIEWFEMEIGKVDKELTKRVFKSLEGWSKDEAVEEVENV